VCEGIADSTVCDRIADSTVCDRIADSTVCDGIADITVWRKSRLRYMTVEQTKLGRDSSIHYGKTQKLALCGVEQTAIFDLMAGANI
jgi:hypothetical protein